MNNSTAEGAVKRPAPDLEAIHRETTRRLAILGDMTLADHHREMLHGSAISDPVIDSRGYKTAEPLHLQLLRLLPVGRGLLIPEYCLSTGELRLTVRPDSPKSPKNKYIGEEKEQRVTAHPEVLRRLREDRNSEVWITEGAKKADALWSLGILAVSLGGVWNYGKNLEPGDPIIDDWAVL